MIKLLLLLSVIPALADEIPGGTVEVNPRVLKKQSFRKHRNIKVKEMEKELPHPDAIPRKEHRDEVFSRVEGLEAHLAKMDQLDRDLLYMRARNTTLAEMQEKTPSIPAAILQKLQLEAKKP